MQEQKLNRFNKLFPWFSGLSSDLLFWVAIDTLFLTVVKNLTASQIVFLTSISLLVSIFLQFPLLTIIQKIGNTKSVIIGSFLLLISSVLLTFGTSYITIVLGKILYEIAFTLLNMINVILKNNLQLRNKEEEYIKFRTRANTIYAIVTMLISFIASFMFNINHYLPMIGCILFCFICFILSFSMIDYSNNDYSKNESAVKNNNLKQVKYSKIVLFIIISYGLFYPIVNSGQSNGKLFIQQELLKNFSIEKTAVIIGIILCISRIVRVISNILFHKITKKYRDKVGFLLPILLFASILFMIIGYLISFSIVFKIILMAFGYSIILFIRDPFKVYIQDLILRKTEKEQHQSLLTILDLSRKIVRTIMSLIFTVILTNNPMILVMIILIVLSFLEIIISLHLYKILQISWEMKI